jgi:hypothetical protein
MLVADSGNLEMNAPLDSTRPVLRMRCNGLSNSEILSTASRTPESSHLRRGWLAEHTAEIHADARVCSLGFHVFGQAASE